MYSAGISPDLPRLRILLRDLSKLETSLCAGRHRVLIHSIPTRVSAQIILESLGAVLCGLRDFYSFYTCHLAGNIRRLNQTGPRGMVLGRLLVAMGDDTT